jgi:hypothetical protein
MSFLVELPLDRYRADAMDPLKVVSEFRLDNARSMMWMSQLAYETPHETPTERKVSTILSRWHLRLVDCINNPPGTNLPLQTACAVIASGRGAMIVAFAGTDPLKIHDWITDFSALPSANGAQTGFEVAVDQIWGRIAAAIANRLPPDDALFFTGHSLGGALAIIAAARTQRLLQLTPTAVYTFGSPRPGDQQFAAGFDLAVRGRIYRLVHGTDIVATVGPSQTGFRHVGHMLVCLSGAQFSSGPLLPNDNDKPDFVRSFFDSVLNTIRMSIAGPLFAPLGPGLFGQFLGILPLQIRDHVPANYFRALGQ